MSATDHAPAGGGAGTPPAAVVTASHTAGDPTGPRAGSRYLDYLPAVFRQDAPPGGTNWLGRFLLGFEAVLTGAGDPGAPGLEETLDGIRDVGAGSLRGVERLFDPGPGLPAGQRAPAEFLDWLSGWVALSLRADIDEERQRVVIANAVRLYRLRGTKAGLEEIVSLYTTLGASIAEATPPLQIGVHSTVGFDTAIDGGPPTTSASRSGSRPPDQRRSRRSGGSSLRSSTWRSPRTPTTPSTWRLRSCRSASPRRWVSTHCSAAHTRRPKGGETWTTSRPSNG